VSVGLWLLAGWFAFIGCSFLHTFVRHLQGWRGGYFARGGTRYIREWNVKTGEKR
jgi:hypothetical protein